MLVDQFTDTKHLLLQQIAREYPTTIQQVKTASVDDPGLPGTAFAFPEVRRFPVHTPEHSLLSKAYATKQASHVPQNVMQRIDNALEMFGLDTKEMHPKKTAAEMLPDQQPDAEHFLLPQYGALLVKEASDVDVSAHALLEQKNKLMAPTLTQAASRLVEKAASFGLDEDQLPKDIYKFAGLTACDAGVLLDWVEARIGAAPTVESAADFQKFAWAIENNFPRGGVIKDRDQLIKLAGMLEDLDQQAEFWPRYDRTLLNPVETVFNMDKIASARTIQLAGRDVPMKELMAMAPEVEDVLGEDVLDHCKVGDDIDPAQFKALIETLPGDLQKMLYTQLKPYL